MIQGNGKPTEEMTIGGYLFADRELKLRRKPQNRDQMKYNQDILRQHLYNNVVCQSCSFPGALSVIAVLSTEGISRRIAMCEHCWNKARRKPYAYSTG